MSVEEIIEWLERQVQKYEVCASCDALSPLAPKYRDSARIMRAVIEKLRTHPTAGDNADKSSDTSARLAAIKDIPTQRLIELAVAKAAGLISILPSAAERAHQDAQPNEPLTLEELWETHAKPAWLDCKYEKGWGIVGVYEYGRMVCITTLNDTYFIYTNGEYNDLLGAKLYRRPPKES